MFGDNDTNEEDEPTEFVMKKGERGVVHIWAVVDGEQVFSAAPHITAVGKTVSAAVESWMRFIFPKLCFSVAVDTVGASALVASVGSRYWQSCQSSDQEDRV